MSEAGTTVATAPSQEKGIAGGMMMTAAMGSGRSTSSSNNEMDSNVINYAKQEEEDQQQQSQPPSRSATPEPAEAAPLGRRNFRFRRNDSKSRARWLWRRVKYCWELAEFQALPEFLRDNEFILKYYRHNWPIKQILLSTFTIHNETINIWTHLVGFLLFLGLTIYTAKKIPLMTCFDSLPSLPDFLPEMVTSCLPASFSPANKTEQCVLQTMTDDLTSFVAPLLLIPTTRWPFFVFLSGAMFCLLSSATCHLLSCHSPQASHILLRLDYAGIAALIATSFYPPVYYSFMCYKSLRNFYLFTITAMGLATISASMIPAFQIPQYRNFRAMLFFCMGVSGLIPCIHKLVIYGGEPAALHTLAYELTMGLFYGVGAAIYATRIPEKWMPGRFDIAGNSHQLFHVLVVMGAFTHYKAGLLYLAWRDAQGC